MAKKKKYIPNVVCKVIESGNHWESCAFDMTTTPKHKGEDLINRTPETKATPDWIVAIEQGKVTSTGYGIKAGYYVYVQHSNGYYSAYMHLKKGTIQVKKNEMVRKGQRLGYMGESGDADGVHLHLAIKPNTQTYVDPYPYLIGELDFNGEWEAGTYKTLKEKYIRTSPKVTSKNYVLVGECMASVKPKLTSNNPKDKARFKIGVEVEITGFATDKKGNLWGKMDTCYICVKDKTGNQVQKVSK